MEQVKKTGKLDDDEFRECVMRIAEPSFRYIRRKIQNEVNYIYKDIKKPDMNDIVNITIVALASIDASIFQMTKKIFREITGHEMDFALVMKIFIDDITGTMEKHELDQLKNKMN